MENITVSKSLLQNTKLTVSARLLLCIIMANKKECEGAMISTPAFKNMLGVSKNTFLKVRKELESKGFIKTEQIIYPDGSYGHLKFYIL